MLILSYQIGLSMLSEKVLQMSNIPGENVWKFHGIPLSVKDNELETKVLSILKETDAPVDPGLVKDCHRLPSKGNAKEVILKLNRRKDPRKVLLNNKN